MRIEGEKVAVPGEKGSLFGRIFMNGKEYLSAQRVFPFRYIPDLYCDCDYVHHILYISRGNPADSLKIFRSSGTNVLDHLAAHGASLTGGQVTVVAVGQIDTNFLGSLHLEAVHSLAGLGNIDLVVIGITHIHSLL